jgi:hypothetical protein
MRLCFLTCLVSVVYISTLFLHASSFIRFLKHFSKPIPITSGCNAMPLHHVPISAPHCYAAYDLHFISSSYSW